MAKRIFKPRILSIQDQISSARALLMQRESDIAELNKDIDRVLNGKIPGLIRMTTPDEAIAKLTSLRNSQMPYLVAAQQKLDDLLAQC